MATQATPRATKAPTKAQEPSLTAQPAPGAAQVPATLSGGGELALPADMMAELAGFAKDTAALERPSVAKISLKAGQITYLGNEVPNNSLDVIVVAAIFRNCFYAGAYDPNQIVNPNCFAVSTDGEDMEPHENTTEPISETCTGCKFMEWGSAGGGSRGKACKETRRLVMMPADALNSAEDVMKAELAVVDIPVTSVRNWSNAVNAIAAQIKRPFWSVITNMSTTPNKKTQFEVHFAPVSAINDPAAIRAIQSRLEEAQRLGMVPYDKTPTLAETRLLEEAKAKASRKF